MSQSSGEITALLKAVATGDSDAKESLFGVVYDDLRGRAGSLIKGERRDHTLSPTALVHEAYLRLVDAAVLEGPINRKYFFAAACRAMRQILIDYARQRNRLKRGGAMRRAGWDDALAAFEEDQIRVEEINPAMERLESLNPRQHHIIDLRYFGGFSVQEIADILEVSLSTVEKDHRMARAFLYGELRP